MSYQLQHVVHMRSIDRDISSYPDPNQYRTVLSHPINIPHGHLCVASVMTAQIPFSFYPVNSKNNTLNVVLQRTDPTDGNRLGDVPASCVINPGNYTATELRDEIQSKLRKTALFSETDDAQANLPKIEVGYESKVNKYTFTVTGDITGTNPELVNVIIKSGTTCGKLLGLPSNQVTVDTDFNDDTREGSVIFTSPYSINVAGDDTLYLRTNLGTGRSMSYETRTQNSGDLLAKIPIRVSPFSIIHYDADESTFKAQIKEGGQIDEIAVRLTDSENRLVDFNGIDNEISIKFEVIKKINHEEHELMKRDPYKQDRTLFPKNRGPPPTKDSK